jgi:acyl-CoA thioesterase II
MAPIADGTTRSRPGSDNENGRRFKTRSSSSTLGPPGRIGGVVAPAGRHLGSSLMPDESRPPETAAELLAGFELHGTGDRFSGRTPPWFGERLFGGIVVAQALMAGIRSVELASLVDPAEAAATSRRPHSLHCYFLRPVLPDAEVEFEVEQLRDGRSFALRQVTTIQDGTPAARLLCSFHVEETSNAEYQLPPPTSLPPPEELDGWDPQAPYEQRLADPVLSEDGATYVASGRHWVRMKERLPDDPAIHCCLVALFSDQTRASFRPHSLDSWGLHTDASLDHAMWFHRPARADQWLRYELQALVNNGNRATVRGLMYDQSGNLVVSMAQELLIRPIPGAERQPAPWTAPTS